MLAAAIYPSYTSEGAKLGQDGAKHATLQRANSSEYLGAQDQLAQEQRLAVQIITTDGQPNELTLGSDESHKHDRADSSLQQRTVGLNGQRMGVGPLPFEEQYRQLERAYEQEIGRQHNEAAPNSTYRTMPKRIVINLGSLAVAAPAAEGEGGQERKSKQLDEGKLGARLTIGLEKGSQVAKWEANSAREATRPLPSTNAGAPKRHSSLEKKGSSKLNTSQAVKQRPTMGRAIMRALSDQGGVPALVMSESDLNEGLANGDMEIMERNRKPVAKLMLNAEMIDRRRRQQNRQRPSRPMRNEAAKQAATSSFEQDMDVLQPEPTGAGAHQQPESENYLAWPSNALEQVANEQQQRHQQQAATPSDHGQTSRTKVAVQQEQPLQQVKAKETSATKQQQPAARPAGSGSRSARSSGNIGRQTGSASAARATSTTARPSLDTGRPPAESMDERVARLLDRLKLYTTKEHLMEVARDLQSSARPQHEQTVNLDEFQTMEAPAAQQMQLVPMEMDGGQADAQQAGPMMLMASQVEGQNSERRARHLERNRVPAPMKYGQQQRRPTEFGSDLDERHGQPMRRVNELESLLEENHQTPDLSTEGSERGANLNNGLNLAGEFRHRVSISESAEPSSRERSTTDQEEPDETAYEGENRAHPAAEMSQSLQMFDRKADLDGDGEQMARPEDELERVSQAERDFERPEREEEEESTMAVAADDQQQQQQPEESADSELQSEQQPDTRAQLQRSHSGTPEQEMKALEQVIDELIARERDEKLRNAPHQGAKQSPSDESHGDTDEGEDVSDHQEAYDSRGEQRAAAA